ncbi:MAG: hypothetical protein A2487_06580 [Candidatus Raymondbacteria bacterium RifOxyC12_full_50_8]|uniref:Secretion system C-terminal sorting domain-containing protein n=1 Tax=Candidatus Raymondbacteria bacterium RIFOXYD12_FULL_49_13 TaxID=1817890 RepID=A0A1F7FHW6_UNCRA|nr:MAG: hypothetical protein A2248_21295 [Candidatus Raymondbacteria bacterium RIFOXYA2_FULL_49_16]OGK02155.1 MAG: hypothetical protein A2350_20160 [Candidatus Raymondbacteria bacterium RifOxyB12_full_50_8]OGK05966.1 MAG: hypothetical protein A2487_06580 [Candidatus Raymondbacteria bacterium RifOxyC12_full_50_8]OGK06324.1 MAG: hypothetical protein A2519_08610 [Candidatus Raymondbacteria bacterium RIFOXYD12_FULL_49_13]OGP40657.1 MAG: hypothetical protein A2324_03365 [Candidatus Raymondbacteria b
MSPADLIVANRIAEIQSGSSKIGYWDITQIKGTAVRDFTTAIGSDFYRIDDLGTPLNDSNELFVWTTQESGGGAFHYTVTAVTGASEDASIGAGNRVGPVSENECVMIWPVEQARTADQSGHVFMMWMPYDKWALDFQGYAYPIYLAAKPEFIGQKKKVVLHMHGASAYFNAWMNDGSTIKTAVEALASDYLMVIADDPGMSWHFGFADTKQNGVNTIADGSVVKNYTQYRNWCMIRWLISGQAPWLGDSNEVAALGHSMGGTGSMTFAIQHPEIFAYVEYASEGINNWLMDPPYRADGWAKNFAYCIGSEDQDLEYRDLISKDKLIDNQDMGMRAWAWLSMRDSVTLAYRNRDDLPFLNFCHGTQDGSIDWEPQGLPVWQDHNANPFAANLFPYSGCWVNRGHSSQGAKGANPSGYVPKNHFVLALKNASSDDQLNPACDAVSCADSGQFNARILWSTERTTINEPPVDSPDEFSTTIKLDTKTIYYLPVYGGSGTETVDITPRRLQQFPRIPYAEYDWQNIPAGGGAPVQNGTAIADQYGMFTIEGFRFSVAGNKLVVTTSSAGATVNAGLDDQEVMIKTSPNPFNPVVTIAVRNQQAIGSKTIVFEIFDVHGNLVAKLPAVSPACGGLPAEITWNAAGKASGVYIVRAVAKNRVHTTRIIYSK